MEVVHVNGSTIWRYLTRGNGLYIDVLVKDNLAQSVTVLTRVAGAAYVDPKGLAFGITPDRVRGKLGPANRDSTNADDGSLDLWYVAMPYAWIYEFHSNKLDFIQLVAAPGLLRTFAPAPDVAPNDGTSLARAIAIRPSNFLSNALWMDVYFDKNTCGNGGSWKVTSTKFVPDTTKHDPFAYTIAHAKCSEGAAERDFYFDTSGTARSDGNNATIYVDPHQPLYILASPSPSPSPR